MLLYSLVIRLYTLAIRLASWKSEKARDWVRGRKKLFDRLQAWRDENPGPLIILHAASLGEFEQGRDLLRRWRLEHPEYRILVSFFSPSGFLFFKPEGIADGHTYLPADTPKNARRFVDILEPDLFVFVRYDFWFALMNELNVRSIPTAVVSAFFRPDMWFFKPYGKWGLKRISKLDAIFTQNEASAELLRSKGIQSARFIGDGRIDRVAQIAEQSEPIPWLDSFKGDRLLFIAGSPWEPDLERLIPVLERFPRMAFLVAPHDIGEPFVFKVLQALAPFAPVRFSKLNEDEITADRQLIVLDTIGMLSRAYQHADLAFIGGGFTTGIHSIQEPAAHGCPMFFGPKHSGFPEADELIERKGGVEVHTAEDLCAGIQYYVDHPQERVKAGEVCRSFVQANRGASQRMLEALNQLVTPERRADPA